MRRRLSGLFGIGGGGGGEGKRGMEGMEKKDKRWRAVLLFRPAAGGKGDRTLGGPGWGRSTGRVAIPQSPASGTLRVSVRESGQASTHAEADGRFGGGHSGGKRGRALRQSAW